MNNTVALPELASRIALIAGIDAETATRYVVDTFAAIKTDLTAGRPAELPGVGSFSLDSESGQLIFKPAPAMADAVNAPFAMFAPVAIPDDAPECIVEDNSTNTPSEMPQQAATFENADPVVMPAEPAEDVPETVADIKPESEPPHPDEEPTGAETAESDYTGPDIDFITEKSSRTHLWLAGAAGLLIGLLGGYLIGSRLAAPAPILIASADTTAVPADTPVITSVDSAESLQPDSVPATKAAEEVIQEESKTKEVATQKEPVYDTVSPARFLTTMARDHYGRKDFWVFIYEANSNHLRHPNRIRPGTRVVIPDLGEHPALQDSLRTRAHQLANEIYSRYNM